MNRNKLTIAVLAALLAAPAFAQTARNLEGPIATGGELAGWVALESANDYRIRARYPESSHALAAGEADPLLVERTVAPHSQITPNVEGRLTVWADQLSFEAPAPVVLHVSVDGLGDEQLRGLVVSGEVLDSEGSFVGRVRYRDGGWNDEAAGDGVFTGTFRFPKAHAPSLAESYLVKIEARRPDGDVLKAASGFLYSRPHARLTGQYRDALVDGDLVISAEVEVAEAGRFHLAGTLYDGTRPMGWAQAAAELEPGRHWIELPYYGLMFHELGSAGPFTLGTVALRTTGAMPNALNDLVETAHHTRAYPADAFRAQPFGDAALLESADRLELDALFSSLRAEED